MISKKLIFALALLLGATSATLAMSPRHSMASGYSSDSSYGAGVVSGYDPSEATQR
jgi:hypothetical protein